MKIQILAGSLSLVLLLTLVPLQPAEAKVFLIDDFSGDPSPAGAPSDCHKESDGTGSAGNPPNEVGSQNLPSGDADFNPVLGFWRVCDHTIDTPLASSVGTIKTIGSPHDGAATTTAQMFRHGAETGIKTTTLLIYDGTANGVAGTLDVSVLNSDNLRLVHSTADMPVTYTARLTDVDGDWGEQVTTLIPVSSTPTQNLFLLTDFVDNPSASFQTLDLAHIEEFSFKFVPEDPETDYDIDLIDITMEMVGGEMFPVDTTALLLAGAQLNAIWILPAIAAIGIGAFIVSRKRN